MSKMRLGYGSEFHLLRFMGRHREVLNSAVAKALKVPTNSIAWVDFGFDPKQWVPDREIPSPIPPHRFIANRRPGFDWLS